MKNKKKTSGETIYAFYKAVYPEMTELAICSNTLEQILKDATETIISLRKELESRSWEVR